MHIESLIRVFWLASLTLQGLLAIVLLFKRFWNSFPLFTAYTLASFSGAIVCFAIRSNPLYYFYAFWVCEGIGIFLGFAVVLEIFKYLFSVHAGLRRMATLTFCASVAVLTLSGALVIVLQSSAMPSRLAKAVLTMAEGTRIVEVGLLGFLFLFSTVFGLHWRQPVFGIALGLGVYVSVELIAVTMHLHFGLAAALPLSLVRGASFTTALLIWLGYILAPEHVTVGELPKREQLEQWNQAVLELIGQ